MGYRIVFEERRSFSGGKALLVELEWSIDSKQTLTVTFTSFIKEPSCSHLTISGSYAIFRGYGY